MFFDRSIYISCGLLWDIILLYILNLQIKENIKGYKLVYLIYSLFLL